ncbi:hypothetical protein TNCV_2537041 [Trichonephila clavipes]|uniref:Uncharacterized protein n=1 Tax=Nephila pilipes TaxID=299642 RepID=A0A8X6QMI4_NEPPI|nr:hypothetical protein NPIL_356131 [Nephila pilipes]GFU81895.1 hypothetical protein TNCV_2537041 [Trichonephila clavipes]
MRWPIQEGETGLRKQADARVESANQKNALHHAATKWPSPRNKACAVGGGQLENWRHRSITCTEDTEIDTSETKSCRGESGK